MRTDRIRLSVIVGTRHLHTVISYCICFSIVFVVTGKSRLWDEVKVLPCLETGLRPGIQDRISSIQNSCRELWWLCLHFTALVMRAIIFHLDLNLIEMPILCYMWRYLKLREGSWILACKMTGEFCIGNSIDGRLSSGCSASRRRRSSASRRRRSSASWRRRSSSSILLRLSSVKVRMYSFNAVGSSLWPLHYPSWTLQLVR